MAYTQQLLLFSTFVNQKKSHWHFLRPKSDNCRAYQRQSRSNKPHQRSLWHSRSSQRISWQRSAQPKITLYVTEPSTKQRIYSTQQAAICTGVAGWPVWFACGCYRRHYRRANNQRETPAKPLKCYRNSWHFCRLPQLPFTTNKAR